MKMNWILSRYPRELAHAPGVYVIIGPDRAAKHVGSARNLCGRFLSKHEHYSQYDMVIWAITHRWALPGIERYLKDHFLPEDRLPKANPHPVNLPSW